MMRELNEPARAPRSLTVHFCAPVGEGEAELAVLPVLGRQFEYRWCVGAAPYSGAEEARVGGWIRPRIPTPLDAPLVVGLMDSFPPAAFARVEGFCNGATMDFTVHFHAPLPLAEAAPDAFYLRTGESRWAAEGYADDLANLWSEDGRLIARFRQLVAVFPPVR